MVALARRLLLGALWVCGLVHGTAGAAWDVTGDVAEHQLLGEVHCSISCGERSWCRRVEFSGRETIRFGAEINFLVGGLEREFYFPCHIWDVILPIDEVIFFRGVVQPPTRF